MRQKTYALVVNLKSRQSTVLIDEIKEVFKARSCKVKIIAVKDPAKLTVSYQKAINMKPDVLVLGGGDGTLVSGIEYLSSKNFKGEIGILPLGTANYLARNLAIPLNMPQSIDILLEGKSQDIPFGIANGKYFGVSFMIGLTQVVSGHVSKALKQKFGQIAYVLELFKQTKRHQPFRYRLESPDLKKPLIGTTHQILVYNSDINKQLKLVPDHQLKKPTLKVVISRCGKSKAKLYIGFLAHLISLGKVRPYMYVIEKTQSLKITTDPRLPGDYDGEPYGKSPFAISMCKHKVHIIC